MNNTVSEMLKLTNGSQKKDENCIDGLVTLNRPWHRYCWFGLGLVLYKRGKVFYWKTCHEICSNTNGLQRCTTGHLYPCVYDTYILWTKFLTQEQELYNITRVLSHVRKNQALAISVANCQLRLTPWIAMPLRTESLHRYFNATLLLLLHSRWCI